MGTPMRTTVAVDVPPAFPEADKPAAGSPLAAEAFAAVADPELVRRYRHMRDMVRIPGDGDRMRWF